MDFFAAILLGMIQGVAEWLPVSSKAMVALAGKFLFGMDYQDALSSAIFLHIGTLLAAIVYFRNDIIGIVKSIFDKKSKKELLVFLIISTAITGVLGVPLLFIALNFTIPDSIFTIIIGFLLLVMAYLQMKGKEGKDSSLTPRRAVVAGFAQGLAAIPGISRSGSTLAALLGEGFPLSEAFRVSFLMSIPAVLGVELALPLLKGGFVFSLPLVVGSIVSAIVGFVTIDAFLKIAARPDFYKVTMGLAVAVLLLGIALMI